MPMNSNADDPRASFHAAIASFGLDAASRAGKTVGDRALGTIADGICERSDRKEGPDGRRWADNAPSTIARKGSNNPNVFTSAMLSRSQIEGEQAVSHAEATMDYGTDDECRAKAGFAHTGQGPGGRVTRPFFAMTESDVDAVVEGVIDDLLNHLLRG